MVIYFVNTSLLCAKRKILLSWETLAGDSEEYAVLWRVSHQLVSDGMPK